MYLQEEKKIENTCNNSNGKTSSDEEIEIITPENWIISTDNFLSSVKKLRGLTNYKAGLETKFTFQCVSQSKIKAQKLHFKVTHKSNLLKGQL